MTRFKHNSRIYPDSKIHGANIVPTWVLSVPGGPHVDLIDPAICIMYTDVLTAKDKDFAQDQLWIPTAGCLIDTDPVPKQCLQTLETLRSSICLTDLLEADWIKSQIVFFLADANLEIIHKACNIEFILCFAVS